MHDEHPHPLLAQVPLTVSPFLNLPTATPLPYTYKQLPSTLPPSILSSPPNPQQSSSSSIDPSHPQQPQQPAYVHSASGSTAHPDQILTSCLALQTHLQTLERDAKATLRAFEERRRAEELAEKRRVAPGWLDGDVRILKPENVSDDKDTEMGGTDAGRPQQQRRTSVGIRALVEKRDGVPDEREGEALDRAFGGMDIK